MNKVVVLLAVALFLPWSAQAGDAAKDEAKKLLGTWALVKVEVGGMNVPPGKMSIAKIVFKDGQMLLVKADGKTFKGYAIKLDPSKKPKAMDWKDPKQKDAPPLPVIYSLDGDELKLCFPLLPKKDEKAPVTIQRPENFDTTDRPLGLFVAKREKS